MSSNRTSSDVLSSFNALVISLPLSFFRTKEVITFAVKLESTEKGSREQLKTKIFLQGTFNIRVAPVVVCSLIGL